MFEVQDLKYATLATVSRCGMVWFSETVVTPEMVIENYLSTLRALPLEESDEDLRHAFSRSQTAVPQTEDEKALSPTMQVILSVGQIQSRKLYSNSWCSFDGRSTNADVGNQFMSRQWLCFQRKVKIASLLFMLVY